MVGIGHLVWARGEMLHRYLEESVMGSKMSKASFASNIDTFPDDARVDVRTTAIFLGVGISTIWDWTKSGRLPQPTRIGRTTRWRLGDIRRIARGESL